MKKKVIYLFILIFLLNFSSFANDKFLSLKRDKANVRFGPSRNSPIKYIYKKINLPLKQIDKKENFRKIVDFKNNSGWIHVSQLKSSNSIIILEDKILFKKASIFSRPVVKLKKGRLLVINKCQINWCKVKTDGYSGWIKNDNVWGSIN